MLTAPKPEPVREAQEILLIDRVEHFRHCPLDDFVLQCGDTQRALAPVRLVDVFAA